MADRTLTDADIDALVAKLAPAMTPHVTEALDKLWRDRLYKNVGKGIVGLAYKGFITVLVFLAAYGAYTEFHR